MTAEWGVRWPDDPDTIEEHDTEQTARQVAATHPCAQLVHRHPGPWIPVTDPPADSPPPPPQESA